MKLIYLILLTLITIILVILIFMFFNKIETFTNPKSEFKYPININTGNIINVPLSKSSTFYNLYVARAEQYEESDINDYILAAYTSFTVINNNNILAILNATNNSITISPSTKMINNDYIFFDLPEKSDEYLLTKVVITFNDRNMNYLDLFVIATVDFLDENPFSSAKKINTTIERSSDGRILTYNLVNNSKLYSNIALVTKTKLSANTTIIINSIELYFINDDGSNASYTEIVSIVSENENENVVVPLPLQLDMDEFNVETATLIYKYNKILKLKVPWGIYDASVIDISSDNIKLKDALNRDTRHGVITGTIPTQTKDTINNVTYLSGSTNTSITFSLGSIQNSFTCCSITKYTNPKTNRNDVLTSIGKLEYKLGHYNGTEGIIKVTDTSDSWSIGNTELNKWIVSCVKSSSNNSKTKSIIINDSGLYSETGSLGGYLDPWCSGTPYTPDRWDEQDDYGRFVANLPPDLRAVYDTDLISNYQSRDYCNYQSQFIINNQSNAASCSDFGFAYMLIWSDTSLLDNELLIISKVLNNFVRLKTAVIPVVTVPITIYDGSTEETAGKSAIDIKKVKGVTATNGVYWIKPDGAKKAMQVFCIMDDHCNGGGWMLAMKGSRNTNTFIYSSDYWTSDNTLIPTNDIHFETGQSVTTNNDLFMDISLDAKYNIYNTYPVTDCLAIFDTRELGNKDIYYTDPAYKQYGWRWVQKDFNNSTPTTLLNFFQKKTRIFEYSYFYNPDPSSQTVKDINSFMQGKGNYIGYTDFIHKYMISPNTNVKAPYNIKIWSAEAAYLSFGFNNYVIEANTKHRVRWGGIFNNDTAPYTYTKKREPVYYTYRNRSGKLITTKQIIGFNIKTTGNSEYPYLPSTVDASGGIGLYDKNAGDTNTCIKCSESVGINRPLSFKWFIR